MKICVVDNCPVCSGGGELVALISNHADKLFYYCYSCGCAWNEYPIKDHGIKNVKETAPDGAVFAPKERLLELGIEYFQIFDENMTVEAFTGFKG